jgi:hypothetical protein
MSFKSSKEQAISTNAKLFDMARFRVRATSAILGIYLMSFFLPTVEWETQYHSGFTAFVWSLIATPNDNFGQSIEFGTMWLPNPLLWIALVCLWRGRLALALPFSFVATCFALYWVIWFQTMLTVGAYLWSLCMFATTVVAMICILEKYSRSTES